MGLRGGWGTSEGGEEVVRAEMSVEKVIRADMRGEGVAKAEMGQWGGGQSIGRC